MANLFGIDVKSEIHNAISPGLIDGVLTRRDYGSRTSGNLTAGQAETSTDYTFKGVVTDFKLHQIDGTRVLRGDKKVLITAGSLPDGIVPDPNDEISIDGLTLTVVAMISRDAAGAAYVLQARG